MSPELVTFSGRRASQRTYELVNFINLLRDNNVTSYLEIGARHGDTFHEVMKSLPQGSRGVAVDYPGAKWGDLRSRVHLDLACKDLRARGYKIDCFFGDSSSKEIRRLVYNQGFFDAIFIDGDHTLDGVTNDWNNYCEHGRILAFHDIAGEEQTTKDKRFPVEVPLFWSRLIKEVDASQIREFIDPEQRGMGIGVVFNG